MGAAFQAAPNGSGLESGETLQTCISGSRAATEDLSTVLESSCYPLHIYSTFDELSKRRLAAVNSSNALRRTFDELAPLKGIL